MKHNDDKLDRLLQSLPQEKADDYFTGRLLARVEGAKSVHPKRKFRFAMVSAAAVTAAIVVPVMFNEMKRGTNLGERQALADELAAIRNEHAALVHQASKMNRPANPVPVYYLGGNDRNDFVLDIRKIGLRYLESGRPGTKPVKYTNPNPSLHVGKNDARAEVYQGGTI